MSFAVAILALAAFGRVVYAGPLQADSDSRAAPGHQSNIVSVLNTFGILYNTTLGHGGAGPNTVDDTDPVLNLCTSSDCVSTSCTGFNAAALVSDFCVARGSDFFSASISQESGAGLPFAVVVGTTNCAQVVQIPAVNECFNLEGGIFNSFARVG
ncbi:hypothetical protein C8Q78DRAFT_1043613 [Trametes maxima]|nr:hypothetical protein C8Q78DRAFT_1043613 [Trametes maxima]